MSWRIKKFVREYSFQHSRMFVITLNDAKEGGRKELIFDGELNQINDLMEALLSEKFSMRFMDHTRYSAIEIEVVEVIKIEPVEEPVEEPTVFIHSETGPEDEPVEPEPELEPGSELPL